ncbi:MAG: hypothetical protein IJM34_08525 [Lachnospiraceae bacterium]|nr:hypothetical protein [Lachnospiraceae bacterium]
MSKYLDIAAQAAVYLIFLLLAAIGSKKRESLPTDKEALSELNGLRGLFALEVIVGHVVRYENSLLFPFGKFMIVSVGFFFYVSGFGLAYSMELYLFQFVWLEMAGSIWEDYRIRLLFVTVLTIAMAALFHPLFKKLRAAGGAGENSAACNL